MLNYLINFYFEYEIVILILSMTLVLVVLAFTSLWASNAIVEHKFNKWKEKLNV